VRFLILGDIHSNLPALDAVTDSATGAFDQIVCLGDMVGYGAHPNPVTDWVRQNAGSVVRGNHDRACAGDDILDWFNGNAQVAALWTYANLTTENLDYLRNLAQGPVAIANFWAVHGSPADEDEYIGNRTDASIAFRYMPGDICFFGHTHLQIGYGHRRGRTWTLPPPTHDETERVHQLEPDSSYLLNPGSVGQPRDSDPRAAYALFDSESKVLTFRRIPYDVASAQDGIRKAGLPEWLGQRLALGR
jgi:predicted phosphodiesterase